MRMPFVIAATAVLCTVAACNSGDVGETPDSQAPAAQNVAAGTASPADIAAVMKARHDHYEQMGKAMKGVSSQLKGGSPDVAAIQRHAATMAGFGPQMLSWFPEDSGREAGETRAKPEIWSDATTFRQAVARFEAASSQFNQAARSGNPEAMRAALPALQGACKNCHDRFRAPEE